MGGAVAICIKGTLMQANMSSDNITGLAGTPKHEKLMIIIFRIMHNLPCTFKHYYFFNCFFMDHFQHHGVKPPAIIIYCLQQRKPRSRLQCASTKQHNI